MSGLVGNRRGDDWPRGRPFWTCSWRVGDGRPGCKTIELGASGKWMRFVLPQLFFMIWEVGSILKLVVLGGGKAN